MEGLEQTLGKYTVNKALGTGTFATVYSATDTTLNRRVALKILHPGLLSDPYSVKQFTEEGRILAQLEHPSITRIYEAGEISNRLYIAIELIDGVSLEQLLLQQGAIPWSETLNVINQIATALDYAHGRGVVHRDVKPSNILIHHSGRVTLTDFGFAGLLGEASRSHSRSNLISGTLSYIAPEIWKDNIFSARSDIYAFGCVIFEMLTGNRLFKGSLPTIINSHLNGPEWPSVWPTNVPQETRIVLAKAVSPSPEDRYDTAQKLSDDLIKLAPAIATNNPSTDTGNLPFNSLDSSTLNSIKNTKLQEEEPSKKAHLDPIAQSDFKSFILSAPTPSIPQHDSNQRNIRDLNQQEIRWLLKWMGANTFGLLSFGILLGAAQSLLLRDFARYNRVKIEKQQFRPNNGRVIGGVCLTLAQRFNIDPNILRVAFIFLALVGISPLIYFFLWMVLPNESVLTWEGKRWTIISALGWLIGVIVILIIGDLPFASSLPLFLLTTILFSIIGTVQWLGFGAWVPSRSGRQWVLANGIGALIGGLPFFNLPFYAINNFSIYFMSLLTLAVPTGLMVGLFTGLVLLLSRESVKKGGIG